jgi:hypothetical protein
MPRSNLPRALGNSTKVSLIFNGLPEVGFGIQPFAAFHDALFQMAAPGPAMADMGHPVSFYSESDFAFPFVIL